MPCPGGFDQFIDTGFAADLPGKLRDVRAESFGVVQGGFEYHTSLMG